MAKKRRRTFGTVAKLPSGRYRARYFYQGVFHNAPETYRAVADANAWLTVEESKILQGTWVPVAGSARPDQGGHAGAGRQLDRRAQLGSFYSPPHGLDPVARHYVGHVHQPLRTGHEW